MTRSLHLLEVRQRQKPVEVGFGLTLPSIEASRLDPRIEGLSFFEHWARLVVAESHAASAWEILTGVSRVVHKQKLEQILQLEIKDIVNRFVADRPITFGETWSSTRSMDYNLSGGEIIFSNEKGKSTGTILPACKLKLDKEKHLEIEAFQNPWELVNIIYNNVNVNNVNRNNVNRNNRAEGCHD